MDVDKEECMVFHSLEDWCEYMLKLCNSKAIYESVPVMSGTTQRDEEWNVKFWGDEEARGIWLEYEQLDGVGDSISIRQVVVKDLVIVA